MKSTTPVFLDAGIRLICEGNEKDQRVDLEELMCSDQK